MSGESLTGLASRCSQGWVLLRLLGRTPSSPPPASGGRAPQLWPPHTHLCPPRHASSSSSPGPSPSASLLRKDTLLPVRVLSPPQGPPSLPPATSLPGSSRSQDGSRSQGFQESGRGHHQPSPAGPPPRQSNGQTNAGISQVHAPAKHN